MTNSQVQTFSMGTCTNPALGGRELRAWPYWSSLVMIVLHPEEESARTNEGKKWEPWSSVDRGKTLPRQAECPQHTVLSMKDTALFGGAPESDRLVTSTCIFCPAVRRLEFIAQHMLEAHSEECKRKLRKFQDGALDSEELPQSAESEFDPGPSGISPNFDIKVQELSDSETGPSNVCERLSNNVPYNSEDPEFKGEQCNVPFHEEFDLPSTSTGLGGTVRLKNTKSSRKRRFSLEKNREYDPDEHCGVPTEPNGKPCCYALSACKLHPVMQRRAVHGRRATYDELVSNCRRRI